MNIALIGCGARGESLAAAAHSLGHAVAACSDASPPRAKRAASRFRAETASPAHAIAAADAALFTDPTSTDVPAALRALHAGKHVYWNAPLAHLPKHARRMLDAAKSSGAVLAPAYAARACPQFAAASTQVAAKSIGSVGFIRVVRRASSGPALDSLAGDIDWIASNVGRVETVFTQVVKKNSVDTAMLTLTLGKGPIVQCVATVVPASPHADIELCGSSGMLQFSTADPILTVSPHSEKSAGVSTSPLDPPIEVRRLRLFFDAVAAGHLTAAQLKHEIHVVRIIETAAESARSGRALKVTR